MKRLICEKLLELMEHKPYERIKVTELVKYIGIGRSTFYSHFDSIYSVLQTIEDEFIAGFPFPDSNLKDALTSGRRAKADYFNYIKRHKRTYLVLNGSNGDPSFKVRLANRSRRLLAVPTPLSSAPSHSIMEQWAIYEFFLGGYFRLLSWWLEHDDDLSVNDMVSLMETLTTDIFDRLLAD